MAAIAVLLGGSLFAQAPDGQAPSRPSFAEFLEGVKADAIARGIREDIVDQAFGGWAKAQKTHFDDKGTFDEISGQ